MTATTAGDPAMDPNDASNTVGPDTGGTLGLRVTGTFPVTSPQAVSEADRIAAVRDRLLSPMPTDRLWGWISSLLITAFAGFFRFYHLGTPHAVIFDETYYVKDAWSILRHGVEWNAVANPAGYPASQNYANNLMLAGHTNILGPCVGQGCGEYVVQPEVGKYLIAVGEWMFGLNPFGWRFASAVFGTLAILLMCRIARRLTRSTLLGCIAGLLLALDGMEFTLSRTGILDIFLMFFVLATFGALLLDRDESRARLAEYVVRRRSDEAGPQLGIRKWRIAAGILLGLAMGCKQDAVWYIPAFIGLAIAWDIGARRAAGLRMPWTGAFTKDAVWLPLTLAVIPIVTYVATWTNWLVTNTGYWRNSAQLQGLNIPVISPLYSLYLYHVKMYDFGVNLSSTHPYMSQPWGWIVLSRPVAFYYESYTSGTGAHLCPSSGCPGPAWSQEVLPLGNPAIWWVSIPVMLFCLGWWLTRRDWRSGASLLAIAFGWLPWLIFVHRTKFDYYSLEFLPFLILCITLCLGLIIGPGQARTQPQSIVVRRAIGASIAGTYVLAVLILFWYFYPILAGQVIPYTSWASHMWYHGWI
jgi:dolichyl-phosphate-mannose--protein O-mannosyl transferase